MHRFRRRGGNDGCGTGGHCGRGKWIHGGCLVGRRSTSRKPVHCSTVFLTESFEVCLLPLANPFAFFIAGPLLGFLFEALLFALSAQLFARGFLLGLGFGLFLCDSLFLREALGLGLLACGKGRVNGTFLLFLRPWGVGIVDFVCLVGRPGCDAGEDGDDVAETDGEKDGEDQQAEHQHSGPESRKKGGESAGDQEVAHGSTGIRHDVERTENAF